ncbi:MAG: dihydroorotase [Cyanobium sp. NAT70]|nr:dihydroorotase [Cyanobium sp. NAT70]
MGNTLLLDPVQVLKGPEQEVEQGAVFIDHGVLSGFNQAARTQAERCGVTRTEASRMLIAPCLVDPHSVLESPFSGPTETLQSLKRCAASGGYGQIALLPRSSTWRDRPDRLSAFIQTDPDSVFVHVWGSFSRDGLGHDLAPHGDQLEHGAIGLAEDDAMLQLPLLDRGLLLAEMGEAPVLLAPRDTALQDAGMVREGVETLRAGWTPDPLSSESLPVSQLLALQRRHPQRNLRLMNLSTADAVEQLGREAKPPLASVCWWHLISDSHAMGSSDPGWRVRPSIGAASDRQSLQSAVIQGLIAAISVHAVPRDSEDMLLPPDQRPPGLSGHHLVLPALWDAFVRRGACNIAELWKALSFGPSKLLNQPAEQLHLGSRRWLLFDPDQTWTVDRADPASPASANLPWLGQTIRGRVTACGLNH